MAKRKVTRELDQAGKTAVTLALKTLYSLRLAGEKIAGRADAIVKKLKLLMEEYGLPEVDSPWYSARWVETSSRAPTTATWPLLAAVPPELLAKICSLKAAEMDELKDHPAVKAVLDTLAEKPSRRFEQGVKPDAAARVTAEIGSAAGSVRIGPSAPPSAN